MCWGLSYQIVDDLKDVLQSPTESGKTSSRDISLDRPNIAHVIGIPSAVERLTRLIRLGDKMLQRLIGSRPEVAFLEKLRAELGEEAVQVARNACETTMRESA
jgi:geranylgeranyl diphosphate synthase type II